MTPRSVHLGLAVLVGALLSADPASAGKRLSWRQDLGTALDELREAESLGVIRFDASWCGVCRKLERNTLNDPRVVDALGSYERILIDVSDLSPARKKLMKHYGVQGYPAILFVTPRGLIVREPRVRGYVGPEVLLRLIQRFGREHASD